MEYAGQVDRQYLGLGWGLKTHEVEGGEGDDFEVFSFYVGS